MRLLLGSLLAGLLLAACGPAASDEFSPTAQCARRCEIQFTCLDLPTGPSERDRAEYRECIDTCVAGLARDCERQTALECLDCWERRTCDEVTNGRCDTYCTGLCDGAGA